MCFKADVHRIVVGVAEMRAELKVIFGIAKWGFHGRGRASVLPSFLGGIATGIGSAIW